MHSVHLPAPLDDFVIDVSDDHGVDHDHPEAAGQDPLQDVEADVGAAARHGFSELSH